MEMDIVCQKKLLLFGASGAIGTAIAKRFMESGWQVIAVSRNGATGALTAVNNIVWLRLDPEDIPVLAHGIKQCSPYAAVCWAQGMNANDSVYSVDSAEHLSLYHANCVYILSTLRTLLDNQILASGAKLCLVSSIWQDMAKQNKLSYTMTKAALRGLVLSAALDLGKDGYLINAILPGVLDTPMTRANLTIDQIQKIENATKFGRLPKVEDVASLAHFLCGEENASITGQFIAVDLGFSHARIL